MKYKTIFIIFIMILLVMSFSFAITLGEMQSYVVADARVKEDASGSNFGTVKIEVRSLGGGQTQKGYWMINISNLTQTIQNASLGIEFTGQSNPSSSYFFEWYYYNGEFNESLITWDNQPCGKNISVVLSPCNNTVLHNISTDDAIFSAANNISFDFSERAIFEQNNDDGIFTLVAQIVPADSGTERQSGFTNKEEFGRLPLFNVTVCDYECSGYSACDYQGFKYCTAAVPTAESSYECLSYAGDFSEFAAASCHHYPFRAIINIVGMIFLFMIILGLIFQIFKKK